MVPLDDVTRIFPHLWTLYRFNGHSTRLELANVKIYNLSGYGLDPMQLEPFFGALEARGVEFASPSTMLKHSWRRGLSEPLNVREIGEGNVCAGREALKPGRRETIPGNYEAVALMDMPAAFPHAMLDPMPTTIRECEPAWHDSGIAEALVTVTARSQGYPWQIITREEMGPEGILDLATSFSTRVRGYWTFDELRDMEEFNYRVQILRAWQGECVRDIFGSWVQWALSIRQLPGVSGILAKRWTNRLWGAFAFRPDSRYTRTIFDDLGNPVTTRINFKPPNSGAHISATISSRVRRRLWRDGLRRGAVACDTDGVILPFTSAAMLDDWRRKEEMTVLEVLSQSAFRYKCMRGLRDHLPIDGCLGCIGERWHYNVQGYPPNSWEAQEAYAEEERQKNIAEVTHIFGGTAKSGAKITQMPLGFALEN